MKDYKMMHNCLRGYVADKSKLCHFFLDFCSTLLGTMASVTFVILELKLSVTC